MGYAPDSVRVHSTSPQGPSYAGISAGSATSSSSLFCCSSASGGSSGSPPSASVSATPGVWISPGATQLTAMPYFAHSVESVSVRRMIAAFEAATPGVSVPRLLSSVEPCLSLGVLALLLDGPASQFRLPGPGQLCDQLIVVARDSDVLFLQPALLDHLLFELRRGVTDAAGVFLDALHRIFVLRRSGRL